MTRHPFQGRLLPLTAWAILLAGVAITAWRASQRFFYWDDFIIPFRYGWTSATPVAGAPTGSPGIPVDYAGWLEWVIRRVPALQVFVPHDRHLIPGSIAVQLLADQWASLQWWLPAGLIVAGYAVSALLWMRVLRPERGAANVIAFAAVVSSPFLGSALGWWSAAINALAWQIACAAAILALRRRRFRGLCVLGAVGCGLLFTEKALTIAPVLTALALISPQFLSVVPARPAHPVRGAQQPDAPVAAAGAGYGPESQDGAGVRAGWRRLAAPLYRPLLGVWTLTVGWAGFYLLLLRASGQGISNPASAAAPTEMAPGPQPIPGAGATGASPQSPVDVILGSTPDAVRQALAPGVLGGPWQFGRWVPGSPFAGAPTAAGWFSVAVVAALAIAYVLFPRLGDRAANAPGLGAPRRRRATALVLAIGYLGGALGLLVLGRSGTGTSDLITRVMHYYSDWYSSAVLFLCAGVAALPWERWEVGAETGARGCAEAGNGTKVHGSTGSRVRTVACAASATLLASSALTTAGYLRSWAGDPSQGWATQAAETMRAQRAPVLPQPVPWVIARSYPVGSPTVGGVTQRVEGGAGQAWITTEPIFFRDDGSATRADVFSLATTPAGREPQCGTRVEMGQTVRLPLSKPLQLGEWTWRVGTNANRPVVVRISTPNGLESRSETMRRAARVVFPGHAQASFIRVSGGGGEIELTVIDAVDAPSSSPGGGSDMLGSSGQDAERSAGAAEVRNKGTSGAAAVLPSPQGTQARAHICLGAGDIGPLLPVGTAG